LWPRWRRTVPLNSPQELEHHVEDDLVAEAEMVAERMCRIRSPQ
jgi:hypothetical protein